MERRPKERYYRQMRKEGPLSELIEKFIERYKSGGIEFEDDIITVMGNIPNNWGPIYEQSTGKLIKWIYVGSRWWAREHDGQMEFGKMYALRNLPCTIKKQFDGLWDESKHAHHKEPILVRDTHGRTGAVVSWNKYELFIKWDDNLELLAPTRFSEIEFEYQEDYKKFKALIT